MKTYNLTWQAETGLVTGLPVRFFVYDGDANEGEGDIVETDMYGFEDAGGEISYARNTVRESGVAQICLTKMPRG